MVTEMDIPSCIAVYHHIFTVMMEAQVTSILLQGESSLLLTQCLKVPVPKSLEN